MSKPYYITLPNRGLLTVTGTDAIEFLQGLVSNDVKKLEEQRAQYACLLTPQGKFLHDFFMIWRDGDIIIDCEGGDRAQDLTNRLNKYKLRSDVTITCLNKYDVYAIFDSQEHGIPDPRHYRLGTRSFDRPNHALEEGFVEWDKERILLGIPDGSRDMIVEKSTMLECGLDRFNAIDWDKGCWMGQELTARMKYRNLGKKSLQTLKIKIPPAPAAFTPLEIGDNIIGDMRSSCGDIALAMVKNAYVEELKKDENPYRLLG